MDCMRGSSDGPGVRFRWPHAIVMRLARSLLILTAAVFLQSSAPRTRATDLGGDWEITFVVMKRGEVRDSTRTPSRDSLVGRMRLARFEAPPPDPRYKEQYVWPGWRGDAIAPFTSLLQVPPLSLQDERYRRLLAVDARRGRYRSSDSLSVGVWEDSTGVRFLMEAAGCSDCGNLFGTGQWQSGMVVGTWQQEFYGEGDSGRWRMRRVDSATKRRE